MKKEQQALIRMRTKAQTGISLNAGSLFVEKDAIFPTGRTRQALKSGARGSSKAARQGGKRPAMMLPARAGRRGGILLSARLHKKRAGRSLQHTLPPLPPRKQTYRAEEEEETGKRGDLLARNACRRRSERSPCREPAAREPGGSHGEAGGARRAPGGRAAEGQPGGPAARLRAEPPRRAPARGVGGTRSPPRPRPPGVGTRDCAAARRPPPGGRDGGAGPREGREAGRGPSGPGPRHAAAVEFGAQADAGGQDERGPSAAPRPRPAGTHLGSRWRPPPRWCAGSAGRTPIDPEPTDGGTPG